MRMPKQHDELDRMARSAELASQLVHDCNNFLYNFLLQLEIWEMAPTRERPDWSQIRNEAKNLAALLQEWQRYHHGESARPQKLDLNQMVRELATELFQADNALAELHLHPEPLWLTTIPGDARRLCYLLLENALTGWQASPEPRTALSIRTENSQDKVIFTIANAGHDSLWVAFYSTTCKESPAASLAMATARTLASRLEASVRLSKNSDGRLSLAVDFPADLSL